MKAKPISLLLLLACMNLYFTQFISGQTSDCDVVQILHNPDSPVFWSPDSSRYFINVQDTAGIFQIYAANAGDPVPQCISCEYSNGNCCGLLRPWGARNKLQVQWHASGNFIICAVEKEFYNELFVPYSIRLGWLQSGLWMDVWAVTPDGNNWYNLANTVHGLTGPAFTRDGSRCVWAEAQDGANLAVDVFGIWKLQRSDFVLNNGAPAFANTLDISPAGSRWNEPGNFSPDGVSLLISSDIGIANAEGQDQFILNVENGDISNLNNSPMVWDEHGVFSPDGKKILFMSSYPYRADTNSYHTFSIKTEFMLMNTDGSDLQQLTHFREPGFFESHEGIAATGFWTPDGTTIYAQSLIFPDYENWIIKFYGNCGNAINTRVTTYSNEPWLTFYPNPAREVLTIHLPYDIQESTLNIFNTLGQKQRVKLEQVGDNSVRLEVAGLKNGMYFIQIKSDKQYFSGTFLKQE